MARTMSHLVTVEESGQTVGQILSEQLGLSKRQITALKRGEEGITVDGIHARVTRTVVPGEVVAVCFFQEKSELLLSERDVPVVYEDEDLVLYNKPAGMSCHPGKHGENDTLANVFARQFSGSTGQAPVFRAVSRLDRDTSGLVLAAKNQYAAAVMHAQAEKRYLALVQGKMAPLSGTITLPIFRPDSRLRSRKTGSGQPAVTHYRVLGSSSTYSLIEIWLLTGRAHQIRVHMSSIGHPLAGDALYGGDLSLIGRQALHCFWMRFTNLSGQMQEFSAPLPEDMAKALSDAGIDSGAIAVLHVR